MVSSACVLWPLPILAFMRAKRSGDRSPDLAGTIFDDAVDFTICDFCAMAYLHKVIGFTLIQLHYTSNFSTKSFQRGQSLPFGKTFLDISSQGIPRHRHIVTDVDAFEFRKRTND